MEKKHREKICNTGKTQGKHREFYLGWNVATLCRLSSCKLPVCEASQIWDMVQDTRICNYSAGNNVTILKFSEKECTCTSGEMHMKSTFEWGHERKGPL